MRLLEVFLLQALPQLLPFPYGLSTLKLKLVFFQLNSNPLRRCLHVSHQLCTQSSGIIMKANRSVLVPFRGSGLMPMMKLNFSSSSKNATTSLLLRRMLIIFAILFFNIILTCDNNDWIQLHESFAFFHFSAAARAANQQRAKIARP